MIDAARNDPWLRPASGSDASAPAGGVNGFFAEGASFLFNIFLRFMDGNGGPAPITDVIEITTVEIADRTNVVIQSNPASMPTFLLAAETGTNLATGVAWGLTPEAGTVLTIEDLMGTTTTRRGSRIIAVPDANGYLAKGVTMTAAGDIEIVVKHRTWQKRFTLTIV